MQSNVNSNIRDLTAEHRLWTFARLLAQLDITPRWEMTYDRYLEMVRVVLTHKSFIAR